MTGTGAGSAPQRRSGFPVWPCPQCGHPNDMLRATCRACTAHRPCEHYDGARHCGATPVHMYPNGPRCTTHSPRTLRTQKAATA